MINSGLFTSKTADWETPQWLFDLLDKEFQFALDPAATAENAKCPHYITESENGLLATWGGTTFLNPPYGRIIGRWVEKAYRESQEHLSLVVCLLPARPDARWWHEWVMKASEIRFIEGRLRFSNGGPAPFPSCVVVFRGWHKGKPAIGPTINARSGPGCPRR